MPNSHCMGGQKSKMMIRFCLAMSIMLFGKMYTKANKNRKPCDDENADILGKIIINLVQKSSSQNGK